MDDRSANALRQTDPFAATDALLSGGMPGESLFVINLCAANMPQAIDAPSVRAWGIPGLETYKLYQVSRLEDGRTRYRVRLGFFTSEADAENVLRSIRGKFATAFTSGLCDEDLKHASGFMKKPLNEIREIQDIQRTGRYRIPKFAAEDLPQDASSTIRQPAVKAPAPVVVPATIARAANAMLSESPPPAAAIAKPSIAKAAPPKSATKSHDEMVEIEWAPEQKAKQQPKAAVTAAKPVKPATPPPPQSVKDKWAAFAQNAKATGKHPAHPISREEPKHTAPAVHVQPKASAPIKAPAKPATVELTASTPPKAATPAAQVQKPNQPFHVGAGRSIPDHGIKLAAERSAPAKATPPANLPRPLVSADALAKLRAAAAQPRNASSVIPTLDTTQTIRTLTKTEKEDANAPKWFVVQLAISDHPANLDTMPRLDIFEAYRLYSVAIMQENVIKHALRLGFFSEKVSAEAVMGYVKTFFGDPVIEQISDAEQKRFDEPVPLSGDTSADAARSTAAQARVITLEEKRPTMPLVLNPGTQSYEPVATAQSKTASKSSAAVKRSPPLGAKKNGARPAGKAISQKELSEARLLGLSDTAIRRVEENPSLLSRLVDKLTK